MERARRRKSFISALAVIAAATVGVVSACGLVAGLDSLQFVAERECDASADCPDDDPCFVPSCAVDAGKCARSPAPAGTLCAVSGGRVCDGKGACVGCNADTDCAGPSDDCQRPACGADRTCGTSYAPLGMATISSPPQKLGDCHTIRCDGQGGHTDAMDDQDLPVDNVECTADRCDLGVPSNPPLPAGSLCGADGKLACDGMGQCAGCTLDAQCIAPDTCGGGGVVAACGCTKATCGSLGKTCGVHPDGCGGTLDCNDDLRNGAETDVDCGGGACGPCAQGKGCKVAADCDALSCVDGVCCNTACGGACVACNLVGAMGVCTGLGVGAFDPPICAGAQACNGAGLCLLGQGQPCDGGPACASTFCRDGICCDQACTGTCQGCNLPGHPAGACSYVDKYKVDPDTCDDAGITCNGAGACKRSNGQGCTTSGQCASGACVDGRCCNSACTGPCRACNVAGHLGACFNVADGTADPACDGGKCTAGACQ